MGLNARQAIAEVASRMEFEVHDSWSCCNLGSEDLCHTCIDREARLQRVKVSRKRNTRHDSMAAR